MQTIRSFAGRVSLGLVAIVLLLFSPVVTFAATPSATTSTSAVTTGPNKPQGPDASTYHFNQATGLWENDYYTWDPVTHETKPKTSPAYTYNPTTKTWDTSSWHYDPSSSKYVAQPTPAPQQPTTTSSTAAKTTGTANGIKAQVPNGGTGQVTATTTDNGTASATVGNTVKSTATTGDAAVSNNTSGGSATSGDASATANVVNLLQSSWSFPNGATPTTFTANINGDVTGDLLLNPSNYTSSLPVTQANGTTKVNVADSGSITNNINLAAASGNATVNSNTNAGNATSGSATAIANVVNMINSMISAGQSFVGTVNINGNLNGDILLPQNLHEQLLASNTPTTTINTGSITNGNTLAQFTNNQAITNTVNLGATSGNATVNGNTTAGNATSGNASTNLTVFNLTGRDIIGSNALLVFVNVLGTWVGMIMNAPAGTTAAMIGGGLSTNSSYPTSTAVAGNSNGQINNNITAEATTGNASVTNNTSAGNAISGDAKAGASIANIANSQLSLADWFGVLFINVLGSWHGSFGVNTAAGNPTTPTSSSSTGQTPSVNGVQVFQFVPGQGGKPTVAPLSSSTRTFTGATLTSSYAGPNDNSTPNQQVLGTATTKPSAPQGPTAQGTKNVSSHFNYTFILATISISAALLLADQALLRIAAARRRRYADHTIS